MITRCYAENVKGSELASNQLVGSSNLSGCATKNSGKYAVFSKKPKHDAVAPCSLNFTELIPFPRIHLWEICGTGRGLIGSTLLVGNRWNWATKYPGFHSLTLSDVRPATVSALTVLSREVV